LKWFQTQREHITYRGSGTVRCASCEEVSPISKGQSSARKHSIQSNFSKIKLASLIQYQGGGNMKYNSSHQRFDRQHGIHRKIL
jgi:hypothetical protein